MTSDLLEAAVAAAKAGAEVLRGYFRDATLEPQEKAEHDLVSRADLESEEAVVGEILRRFPSHHILAEEGGAIEGAAGEHQWFLDPLDGTSNFLQGLPIYCVSVACRREGQMLAAVVLDPEGGNLFTAAAGAGAQWNGRPMAASRLGGLKGSFLATGYPFRAKGAVDLYLGAFREIFLQARSIRRCGAAALDLAYTAAGIYDGFFEFRLSPWDLAAGSLLIREAGGLVSDLDGGESYLSTGNLVAGGPGVQPDLLAAIRLHADEESLRKADPGWSERADGVVLG